MNLVSTEIYDVILTDDFKDAVQDMTLDTAILLSLFTNRRAGDEDELPQQGDKQGWLGTEILDNLYPEELILGSKLWLLQRSKIKPDTLSKAKEYAEECLQWLITFNVAERVDVIVSRVNMEMVSIQIDIYRPDDDQLSYRYYYNWEQQVMQVDDHFKCPQPGYVTQIGGEQP